MEASMSFSFLNDPKNDQRSIDRKWWISRAAFSLSLTACPPARVSRDCRWAILAPNKVCTVKSCTNAHSIIQCHQKDPCLHRRKTHPALFCNEKVPCGRNFRCYNDTRMDFNSKVSYQRGRINLQQCFRICTVIKPVDLLGLWWWKRAFVCWSLGVWAAVSEQRVWK